MNKRPVITIFLVAAFLFFIGQAAVYSQTNAPQTPPANIDSDPLVIKIAVFGPGDDLYLWWGHIGLIIENYSTNRARFYDWGVFSFENENFFSNFAFGRLLYSCEVTSPQWVFDENIYENRDISVYTLNLSPQAKEKIREYAEWTVLPENRDYWYHHFNDNCATRVRDIIDMATDGQFKAEYQNMPGALTLRQEVRRHTWFNPFFDWFLSFLMGQGIDRPATVWEEMFLPSEVGLRVQEFTYTDSNGAQQKLLQSAEIKNLSDGRPAVLNSPRPLWPLTLSLSCAAALLSAILLFFKTRDNQIAGILWAAFQGLLGLFFGTAGTVLCFMSFFTNHDYTYRNINVLFANPLLLAAVPFGILYCIGLKNQNHYKWEALAKTLWSCIFVLEIISVLINVIFLGQQNQADICLVLPFTAVLSWLPQALVYVRREYLWRWLN